MGEKALRQYLEFDEIMKLTATFLKSNAQMMINSVSKNQNDILAKDLNTHFQWIIKHTSDDTIEFFGSKTLDKSIYQSAYNKLINNVTSLQTSTEVKITLKDYFNEILTNQL